MEKFKEKFSMVLFMVRNEILESQIFKDMWGKYNE